MPVGPHTLFNVCSVTKTFTSLAVLQLAAANKLQLNDPVSDYLPQYAVLKGISMRQLLSHTSGLPNPIPLRWIHLREEDPLFDSSAFAHRRLAGLRRVRTGAGLQFFYSNLNYLALGAVIEAVSGQAYKAYIRQHLLALLPCNGCGLDFTVPPHCASASGYQKKWHWLNLALGFFLDRKKFTAASANRHWIRFQDYYVDGAAYGGLVGHAEGLAQFAHSLFAAPSPLLSEEWKKVLLMPQEANQQPIDMTLGWFTGRLQGTRYFAHPGGGGGFYCELRAYPAHHLVTAIVCNRSGIRNENLLQEVDGVWLSPKR